MRTKTLLTLTLRFWLTFGLGLILTLTLLPIAYAGDPGDLDPGFGNGGIVTTTIGISSESFGVALQPDGKIIAVGRSHNGSNWDLAMVRYHANGSLDTSFGSVAVTSISPGYDLAYEVVLQPDGKIVVVGSSANGANFRSIVIRYLGGGDPADLALTKSVAPSLAAPGQTLTYTLRFSNTGGITATGVMITDPVPITLTHLNVISTGVPITRMGGTSFTWQVAPLAPGQGGMITLTGRVASYLSSDTRFTNTATITSVVTETVTSNNSAQVGVTVQVPELAFSSLTYPVDESTGQAVLTVTLSPAPLAPVTVHYMTGDDTALANSDYVATSGLLTFNPGVTALTFTVPITDDLVDETDEQLTVELNNPSGASLASPGHNATLTILDNDSTPIVQFSQTSSNGDESASPVPLQLTLSHPSSQAVTVDYTVGGSATGGGVDYTLADGVATIAAGTTLTNITLTVHDDDLDEPSETVVVTLTQAAAAGLGANTSRVYTIIDNDGATVKIKESGDTTHLAEGGLADTYEVVLTSQPTAPVTITLHPDSQLEVAPANLYFSESDWSITQTVTVTAVDDLIFEQEHTGAITHTATSADNNYHNLGIVDVVAYISANDELPGEISIYLPTLLKDD